VRRSRSTNASLVSLLEGEGVLRSKAVKDAIISVPRELFVWEGYEEEAYADWPLPLGRTGQTISAPHMVALMLEELQLSAGMKVLEVGCGSGWNAACIGKIIGRGGRVVTVELNEELVEFATRNVRRAGLEGTVEIHQGDGSRGWPPMIRDEIYDRVVFTAGTPELPDIPLQQLRRGGILLVPLGDIPVQMLTKFVKGREGSVTSRSICPCVFVPLVKGEEA